MAMDILINVAEEIGSPSALTQEQGDIIFSKITAAISNNMVVRLDFSQIESMISPFLNNSIGQLYSRFTGEDLQTYLKIENFPPEKSSTLNIVIANAKRYYTDKEKFNSVAKGVFD